MYEAPDMNEQEQQQQPQQQTAPQPQAPQQHKAVLESAPAKGIDIEMGKTDKTDDEFEKF
ncbi:MAG: hypothetical protein U9N42_05905 [Campylobacterota bacterium]|nr:hypothetical protein [Campylobacterota bacterium]